MLNTKLLKVPDRMFAKNMYGAGRVSLSLLTLRKNILLHS